MERENIEVTIFLDKQNHPFRSEIETLRLIILGANKQITENIKWNAPNYCFAGEDKITMRIQPSKQVQLIFHRGAKAKEPPKDKLLKEDFGILAWKANDRAIATFKNMQEIENYKAALTKIVTEWINVSK